MTVIILLIIAGLILLILEFFVFPGITVAGIGGLVLVGTAVFIGYDTYGSPTGNIILALTLFAMLVVLGMALRANTWNKLMLKTTLSGKIETVSEETIKPGDKGITISRLNPIGKALINNFDVEAHCPGSFVDPGTKIEVVKVFKTYVIVKPEN